MDDLHLDLERSDLVDPDPADLVEQRDRLVEMFRLMSPRQRQIAILRLEGICDTDIGRLLDLHPKYIAQLMDQAVRKISRRIPELASSLRGRHREGGRRRFGLQQIAPLEHGWACPDTTDPDAWTDLPTLDDSEIRAHMAEYHRMPQSTRIPERTHPILSVYDTTTAYRRRARQSIAGQPKPRRPHSRTRSDKGRKHRRTRS